MYYVVTPVYFHRQDSLNILPRRYEITSKFWFSILKDSKYVNFMDFKWV